MVNLEERETDMKKKNVIIAGVASLVVIAATTYLIIRKRQQKKDDAVPADAPQLPIENPGDQSEFPAGPSGGQELG